MPPAQQQQPQEQSSLTFETFAGVQTSTTRPGVPDQQAYWLDGMMPIAPRNLRTLYGIGAALYTAAGGNTIIAFDFYNIGATPYAVIFLSDGSAVHVNTLTGAATTILAASTILSPVITNIGTSQYGQQYLIIVANQTNGYWVWDGSILYTSGTLAPGVILTNVGAGYLTPPVVTATGGFGSGATFVATINSNGNVSNVIITNPGSGYQAGDSVSLVFTGGTQAGTGASVTAVLTHQTGGSGASLAGVFTLVAGSEYQLTGISIINHGSNYTSFATTSFGAPPGSSSWKGGSAPTLSPTIIGGSISSVSINPTGLYYVDSSGFPSVNVSDPAYYYVSSTSIHNAGSNYGGGTNITASGGGSPQSQATFGILLVGGSISSVDITSGGVYGSNSPPTLTVNSSSVTAAGSVFIMPYGIHGTAVETYQGHVWVFNGNVFNFSAPGSVYDFATSDGGGSDQSNASYLKVGYTNAVSTNGFLFLIGDSSMDYISGVSTNTPQGGSPTTTYTQNNSDPEVGTPYPAVVTTLGQNIMIANSTGVFVSSGGAFVKRSEALDGVFTSVPNFAGLQLSVAKAEIFGKRVWMVLVPIIDPITGTQPQTTNAGTSISSSSLSFASVPTTIVAGMGAYDVTNPTAIPAGTTVQSVGGTSVTLSASVVNPGVSSGDTIAFFTQKLLMFNGRDWWASLQDVALTFIAGQEINSVYTAWGTDGTHLYPLFQVPSTGFVKRAQSKLWDIPSGIEAAKVISRFWSLWYAYSTTGTAIELYVDQVGINATGAQFTESDGTSIPGPTNVGYFVSPPQAVAANGVLIGMGLKTSAADMALVTAKFPAEQPIQWRR
jgi:hypothetical protein